MRKPELILKELTEKYKELEAKQDALYEHLKKSIPKGTTMRVQRGRSIWTVTMVGADFGQSAGYFRAKSQNGKIHTFHFSDIDWMDN